jgi:hypothetical protein
MPFKLRVGHAKKVVCGTFIPIRPTTDIYSKIPFDVEILLTHTPPAGTRDVTSRGKSAGCPFLTEALTTLTQCRLHVFGHIHEAHGFSVSEKQTLGGHAKVSVNGAMRVVRPVLPVVVDLRD